MSKKRKSGSTFEVNVSISPLAGDEIQKTVSVPASATIAEVVKAAGINNAEKKNFLVDDKPATLETRVTANSKIRITERPQGS